MKLTCKRTFTAELKHLLKQTRLPSILLLTVNSLCTLIYLFWHFFSTYTGLIGSYASKEWQPIDITKVAQLLNVSFILYAVFALCMVPALFRYLHKPKSMDFYHGFPLKKSDLLLSRFFAIAIPICAGAVIQIILTFIMQIVAKQYYFTYNLTSLFVSMAASCVTALAFTGGLIFCMLLSKKLVSYFVCSVFLQGVLPYGVILLLRFPQEHVAGFYVNDIIAGYLFPLGNIGPIITGTSNGWMQLLSMAIVCALTLWIAANFYTRQQENGLPLYKSSRLSVAGMQFGIQLLCIGFLSALMGVLLSGGDPMLKSLRERPLFAVAILFPVALAGTLLAERLLSLKRSYKKALLQLGCVYLVALCGAGLLQWGMTGYEQRVPKMEEVASVVISDNSSHGTNRNNTVSALEQFSMGRDNNLLKPYQNVTLRENASIEAVIRLHQQSLSFYHGAQTRDRKDTYTITYQLINGKTITRSLPYARFILDKADKEYFFFDFEEENKLAAAFKNVISLKEGVEKSSPIFLQADQLAAVLMGVGTSPILKTPQQVAQVREALQNDMKNTAPYDPEDIVLSPYGIYLYFDLNPLPSGDFLADDDYRCALYPAYTSSGGDPYYVDCYYFQVPETYRQTIAVLSQSEYWK